MASDEKGLTGAHASTKVVFRTKVNLPRWEYVRVHVDQNGEPVGLDYGDTLDGIGSDGWELVCSLPQDRGETAALLIFKRRCGETWVWEDNQP